MLCAAWSLLLFVQTLTAKCDDLAGVFHDCTATPILRIKERPAQLRQGLDSLPSHVSGCPRGSDKYPHQGWSDVIFFVLI